MAMNNFRKGFMCSTRKEPNKRMKGPLFIGVASGVLGTHDLRKSFNIVYIKQWHHMLTAISLDVNNKTLTL
jgi:hypothetical protein